MLFLENFKEKTFYISSGAPIEEIMEIVKIKRIKKYFKKNMKKFFPSQKFIEENEDGIVFEISYTQPLEILPFIKRWLPNMEIIEPKELKEGLKKPNGSF